VKKGVNEAGGTPRKFTTITVTDGIAMGHQGLKSGVARPDCGLGGTHHARALLDALVGLAGCDNAPALVRDP
jgi:dihydroxy-acid dehydratase